MPGKISFIPLGEELTPFVHRGPLLDDLLSPPNGDLDAYLEAGGYEVAQRVWREEAPVDLAELLETAGLRGRAGGGFPTGHKWAIACRAQAERKFFVCNAHAAQPGGFKERFLLRANPHKVLEAMIVAARGVDAGTAILFLGRGGELEEKRLRRALGELKQRGLLGEHAFASPHPLEVAVLRSPGGYITGEETAILELLEGRPGLPRRKPPVPAMAGLWKCPTVVNNLETTLHAYTIVKYGAEKFRRLGTKFSPGTLVFSLSGSVERPGLYELPLGTSMRELIFEHGGGPPGGRAVKAVFPGGVSSRALGGEALDLRLDYDSVLDAGSDLGSGTMIVVPEETSMVDLAVDLQGFLHESSCGKCQPCKDGTRRTLTMLRNIEHIDQRSIDLMDKERPESPRKRGGLYVIQEDEVLGGLSYTDVAQGLGKITSLCQFYEHRGDCHHSKEASRVMRRLIELFADEFEARIAPAEIAQESTA